MTQEYTVEQLNYGRKVIDFIRWEYLAFVISVFLLITSIIIVSMKGFNWSVDFTGGIIIEINLEKPFDIDQIRKSMQKICLKEPSLQNLDGNREIIIRMAPIQNLDSNYQALGNKVINTINEVTHQNATIKCIEFIGPSVGADLFQSGIISLMTSLIFILVYVSYRFEWRLATGVVIALLHDIIITMGTLSLFHIEIDLTIIASLMSVISYSLNDSIVVLDRIRENFCKISYGTSCEIFNVSLTQMLHRTLITSGITLTVILMLYLFGGPVLRGFSLTMLIGVFIGTVSSIYVTSALALKLGTRREHLLQQKIEKAI